MYDGETVTSTQERCVRSYEKTGFLRLVAADLELPWQLVYVHLREAGVNGIAFDNDFTRCAAQTYRTDPPDDD